MPGIGSARGFSAKAIEKELYYSFSSYVYPNTIFKYEIESGISEIYEKPKIDFNPSDYQLDQLFFKSKDGTKIPMFVTYKKGIIKNGMNPTIFMGTVVLI